MLLDHVCFTNETVVLLKCDFYSGRGRRSRTDRFLRVLSQTLSSFSGGLWLFVGSAYVFWKLLAGIRGTLTDRFLRESSVIQQWCQSKRPASNTCSEPLLWWSFQSWKLWKTTEAQIRRFFFPLFFLYLFFHLFISLTDKGQMVIQSLLEFQNRPPSFHSTPPPRPPPPSPPPRPSRGQARVPVMEQIHQDTF